MSCPSSSLTERFNFVSFAEAEFITDGPAAQSTISSAIPLKFRIKLNILFLIVLEIFSIVDTTITGNMKSIKITVTGSLKHSLVRILTDLFHSWEMAGKFYSINSIQAYVIRYQ